MFIALFGFPLVLICGVVLLLLTGTNDLGDLRENPATLYASFMTLTGVLLLLFATFLAAHGLTHLGGGGAVNHDQDVSQAVVGVIAAAVAIGLLRFHLPKLQDADDKQMYAHVVHIVCGAALLTGVAAAGSAAYALYAMVAPETSGVGAFTDGLRSFIASAALAAMAGYVFAQGWKRSAEAAPAHE